MMRNYARIENGVVMEQLETDGNIADMFPPQLIWIDVTGIDGVADGWIATENNGEFTVTAPPAVIPRPEEILAVNSATRDQMLAVAAVRIAPLQYAVDLDDATASEAEMLTRWKQYSKSVNRVNLTVVSPEWPQSPDETQ